MSDEFLLGGFRDAPAWHGYGKTKVGGWESAIEALKDVGMLKEIVHACPMTITLPDGTIYNSDKLVMMREPIPGVDDNWQQFKTISDNYNIVTPQRIGELLDADPNPLSKTWPVNTLGMLGKGERLFITLKMEGSAPLGDEHERHDHYLFIADDYRGNGSISIMETAVRVVCNNTWNMAFDNSKRRMTFPHIGDPDKMMELRIQLEKAAIAARKETVEQLEAMMQFYLDEEQRKQVVEAAFRTGEKDPIIEMAASVNVQGVSQELLDWSAQRAKNAEYAYNHSQARNLEHRVNVMQLFQKFNDEQPRCANTAYALLNAVNEYSDFRKGRGKDNRPMQVLFGGRAQEKKRAYQTVMQMMK